jgi:hypothetical protein
MWHAYACKMVVGNPEDLGVNVRIILKWICKIVCEDMGWIVVCEDMGWIDLYQD